MRRAGRRARRSTGQGWQPPARYEISVANPGGVSRGVARALLDGDELATGTCEIALADDGATHRLEVTLG